MVGGGVGKRYYALNTYLSISSFPLLLMIVLQLEVKVHLQFANVFPAPLLPSSSLASSLNSSTQLSTSTSAIFLQISLSLAAAAAKYPILSIDYSSTSLHRKHTVSDCRSKQYTKNNILNNNRSNNGSAISIRNEINHRLHFDISSSSCMDNHFYYWWCLPLL